MKEFPYFLKKYLILGTFNVIFTIAIWGVQEYPYLHTWGVQEFPYLHTWGVQGMKMLLLQILPL